MTLKGHGVIRDRCDLVYDPKTSRGIRGRCDQLYNPKDHGDLYGRFDLVYDHKRLQGHVSEGHIDL